MTYTVCLPFLLQASSSTATASFTPSFREEYATNRLMNMKTTIIWRTKESSLVHSCWNVAAFLDIFLLIPSLLQKSCVSSLTLPNLSWHLISWKIDLCFCVVIGVSVQDVAHRGSRTTRLSTINTSSSEVRKLMNDRRIWKEGLMLTLRFVNHAKSTDSW